MIEAIGKLLKPFFLFKKDILLIYFKIFELFIQTFRFPFIASEIFNCELSKINDLFFISLEEEEADHGSEQKSKQVSSPLPTDEDEEFDQDDEET